MGDGQGFRHTLIDYNRKTGILIGVPIIVGLLTIIQIKKHPVTLSATTVQHSPLVTNIRTESRVLCVLRFSFSYISAYFVKVWGSNL